MSAYKIAVIPGDGIGLEVVPEGLRALEKVGARFGIAFEFTHYGWGCGHYERHGTMMPKDGPEQLRRHDAIFFGAVGWPSVPDHVAVWDLIIRLRRELRLYVNLRPVRLLRGIRSPLEGKTPGDIDFLIVRENNEGEYSDVGGRGYPGFPEEVVIQTSIFTRAGVDRVLRYAYQLAAGRPRRQLTSATKSNGLKFAMPFWDERFAEVGREFPDVRTDQYHIDILTAHFVRNPHLFDVIVASNLFGDILSDLGPAIAGSIGIAPSANINPERAYPSLFEPVHGSAPDIAGLGVANPIAQVWAAAMMLSHLGEVEAAEAIEAAIEHVLAEGGPRTRDLGGSAGTEEVGRAIAAAI